MLVFSCYTNPLYPNYFGYDSAIFSLLGKDLAQGKELYSDLFDHKGPVIFFINALGHKIAGNTGRISLLESPVKFFVQYLPIVICAILLLSHVIKSRKLELVDILLSALLVGNIATLFVANRFPHYITIFFPVYSVFIFKYFEINKRNLKTYLVLICTVLNLCFATAYSCASFYEVHISKTATIRYETIKDSASLIPENEKNQVIGYKISSSDYLSADIIPCYKYYTLQDTWAISNPQIYTDFIEWAETEKPMWFLIKPSEDNNDILELLENHYEFQFNNEYISYYRIKQ